MNEFSMKFEERKKELQMIQFETMDTYLSYGTVGPVYECVWSWDCEG